MEKEAITFARQLLEKFDANIKKLEEAKEDNDPVGFNEIKKNSFDIHQEIQKLLQ
ncbi:hypothetical protein GW931_00485 [archaeon]|nr:hypothetical protein [archaeon]